MEASLSSSTGSYDGIGSQYSTNSGSRRRKRRSRIFCTMKHDKLKSVSSALLLSIQSAGTNNRIATRESSLQSQQQKQQHLLHDLPHELLIHIMDWLDTSNLINSSFMAVSETSRTMNHLCHTYMKRRWDNSSSTTTVATTGSGDCDDNSTWKDGIIQRLTVEDPKTAAQLYQQYIQKGGDDDNSQEHHHQHSKDGNHHTTTTSTGAHTVFGYHVHSDWLQQWVQRPVQSALQCIHQQLRTEYRQHLHACAVRIPHPFSIILVVVAVVFVTCGIFVTMEKERSDSSDTFDTTKTAVTALVLVRVIVALMVPTAAAMYGMISQQNAKSIRQQQVHDEWDVANNTTYKHSTTKSIRRSYSQPELSHMTKYMTQRSISHVQNPRQSNNQTLKRSPTVASLNLASFQPHSNRHPNDHYHEQQRQIVESYDDFESSPRSNITSNRFKNHFTQFVHSLSFGNLRVLSSSLDDLKDDSDDDDLTENFDTYMYLEDDDDDHDNVDVLVKPTTSLSSKFRCATPIHRHDKHCINVPSANHSVPTRFVPPAAATSATWTKIKPRGWVGMYHRALQQAKKRIVHMVHDSRVNAHKKLNMLDRNELSTSLMNACSNDSRSLSVIRVLSKSIPTQDFYIGADGTESCALHTAAFHGAAQIIDFLCRDIDTTYKSKDNSSSTVDSGDTTTYDDGGLCDVNVTDMNGWTALHYAAGANSVDVVRVLVRYGASLHIPAVNGYTPLQWAIRLQHHDVANELRAIMAINQQEQQKRNHWLYQSCLKTHQPIVTIVILSLLLYPMFSISI